MLTHYHFPIVMVACAFFVTARLVRRNRRRLFGLVFSFAVGTIVFMAMHPGFYDSIRRAQRSSPPVTTDAISLRIDRTLSCYASFLVHPETAKSWLHPLIPSVLLAVLGASMLTVAIVYGVRRWKGGTKTELITAKAYGASLSFLAWMAFVNIALFMLFISPKHAMGPRYASTVWPFLAMSIIPVLRWFGRRSGIVVGVGCLAILASGIAAVPKIVKTREADRDPIQALAGIKQGSPPKKLLI